MNNNYVLVSFVDEIPVHTTFSAHDWPLHVTIIRPFISKIPENELIQIIDNCLANHHSYSVHGLRDEMFGPDKNIRVTELEYTQDIQVLHNNLSSALDHCVDFKPSEFNEYRPHITEQENKRINIGEKLRMNSVSLVMMGDSTRTVVHTSFLL